MQIYSQKCNVFERIETLKWLHEQVGEGFYPKWFITYHLHHPQELVKPIKETNNPFGYKTDMDLIETCGTIYQDIISWNGNGVILMQ